MESYTNLNPRQSGYQTVRNRGRDIGYKKGQAFVGLILGLVVLFGFTALAIDYGMTVMRADHLQKGCDAAALAAAIDMHLNPNSDPKHAHATNQADNVGSLNNVTVTSVTFNGTSTTGTLTVTGQQNSVFYFAPIIGFRSVMLVRHSNASYSGSPGYPVLPFAIDYHDWALEEGNTADPALNFENNVNQAFSDGHFIPVAPYPSGSASNPTFGQLINSVSSGSGVTDSSGAAVTESVGNNVYVNAFPYTTAYPDIQHMEGQGESNGHGYTSEGLFDALTTLNNSASFIANDRKFVVYVINKNTGSTPQLPVNDSSPVPIVLLAVVQLIGPTGFGYAGGAWNDSGNMTLQVTTQTVSSTTASSGGTTSSVGSVKLLP